MRDLVTEEAAAQTVDVAAAVAKLVEAGQRPAALSARDGRLLKPVPLKRRLSASDLLLHLRAALKPRPSSDETFGFNACAETFSAALQDALTHARGGGHAIGRHVIAIGRALAYQQAGDISQAEVDGRLAVAYDKTWAVSHAVLALVTERLGTAKEDTADLHTPDGELLRVGVAAAAAVHMRRAFELQPACDVYAAELKRLARRLPEPEWRSLMESGAAAYLRWLDDAKWRTMPEFLRPRPKFYYYYEWMRSRLEERFHGPEALPGPVQSKLLELDADELDLLLQYPAAIAGQAEEYVRVLRERGEDGLAAYRSPELSWEEVKALKGPATVGLGLGAAAPGEGFLGNVPDTNHALVGSAGDGGLTAEERSGKPVVPQLGPDHARDRDLLLDAAQREAMGGPQLEGAENFRSLVGRQQTILTLYAADRDAEAAAQRVRVHSAAALQSGRVCTENLIDLNSLD